MKRRNFLKVSGLVSTSTLLPNFLQSYPGIKTLSSRSGKKLIVIQLSGGNDGLNTIIPYADDMYYRLRPSLSIPTNQVIKINDHLGFHPALAPLQELYDEGQISIINNVGYPNPDRSHFRSMDIWQTGSASNEYLSTGWLGRYLDNHCQGEPDHVALELDDGLSLALKGMSKNGFAMSDAKRIKKMSDNSFLKAIAHDDYEEENVAYLYKTLIDTQSSAEYLYEKSKLFKSKMDYPISKIGRDLKKIGELITADTDTKIYYASMSGFDTHANQKNTQQRLLKQYADAVYALVKDLQSNGLLKDVLILTFSEFGRRAKQNASNGTDHGTANNVFLIGDSLTKAGFFNPGPNLTNLESDDLIFEVDFRGIYAEILDNWLDGSSFNVLNGMYNQLSII